MTPKFQTLHPRFVAEVSPVDLRLVHDRETLGEIREGMDEYAVLVFRDQPLTDAEQLDFAQRLDGQLHARTGAATIGNNRLGDESLTDISNVGPGRSRPCFFPLMLAGTPGGQAAAAL
jgi:alpha-ketoglutarate-dependent 2,4-dichlorophenoxyacetate dioxygenase